MDERRERVRRYIQQALQTGDYLGWFEKVYADATNHDGLVPWALQAPHPLLVEWAEQTGLVGSGQRAVVVGCGLGDDAEYLAGLGFVVTAFDVSATAIAACKKRFPQSTVVYAVADLLALPQAWLGQYDFVFESRTIQALPWHLCATAIAGISSLRAPSGQILVICRGRDPHEDRRGIPWPLSTEELAHFEAHGVRVAQFDDLTHENDPTRRQFRVLYRKSEPQA